MTRILNKASAIAVAATVLTALVSAEGSSAFAESNAPVNILPETAASVPAPIMISQPVVQAIPAQTAAQTAASETDDPAMPDVVRSASSLAALVAAQPQPGELPRELHCLAGAIYFEAKGESLAGQLAVGRVVVARAKSGRFPNSYCGVVFQRSQFSFVRGNAMPSIAKKSAQWRNAVAVAQIAHAGTWQSETEGALFFHATYVSPGWKLKRVGRIEGHVFYR
jgi:spore germination cell wall hydrolase CwlJ-like protein